MGLAPDHLLNAIVAVPPGGWAVGVSGGADSVALLMLLQQRADLSLHVVHLDHQTRGQASTDDAAFVHELAQRRSLPITLARLSDIAPHLADPPANPSARYRAARLELFRQVVAAHALRGVVLAHHADDQAETVMQRLLRGSGYSGLGGMRPDTTLAGLRVLRPLLGVRREALRAYLTARGEAWREDASNQSDAYARNRARRVLDAHPAVADAMLKLGEACAALRAEVWQAAPELPPQWAAREVAQLPQILAEASVARWLKQQGVSQEIDPATIERVMAMAVDAATPPRMQLAPLLLLRRRAGKIFIERVSSGR
jgi:tRNA(Ile)-lysidine synthase